MKFRRLMAASMAGVMAVSSSIVCQVTASAAGVQVVTDKEIGSWNGVGINLASEGNPTADATVTITLKNAVTESNGYPGQVVFKILSSDWSTTYVEETIEANQTSETSFTYSIADDLGGNTNILIQGGISDIVVSVSVSAVVADNRNEATASYDGSPITMVKSFPSWAPGGAAQANIPLKINLDGATTYGEIKAKFKNLVVDGVEFIKDSIGGSASDYSYCLYVKWGDKGDIWSASGADSLDSTIKWGVDSIGSDTITDSTVLFEFGIQINVINMSDTVDKMKDGETFIINSDEIEVDSVKITAVDGSAVNTEVTFGDEITLKADVTPADADGADKVEWSSDDPDVAEVSTDGKISFKKAGKVVITAKAGGKSASVTFNVAKKTFTYNGGWNNVIVDGTKDLDTLLKAEADSFNIIPASSPYVSLVNGKDYTASAQVAADKKSYDLTVKLIGDAADNYELTNPTFKGGYIYYHMSSLALNKTSLNLIAGGKGEALTAVTTPDNALLDDLKIAYESTDPTVATVDSDGNVTPVKAGTATIKVTATANAIVGQAVDHVVTKTAECQVTVTDVAIPATKIHLDAKEKTLTAGDKTKLTATVTPADSTDSVTWKSSDESVAAVDKDGNVTAKAAGTATITATAGEYSAECAVTVKAKEPDIVPDDNKYTSIPKTSTKIDSVATTINSDGTRNMLAVFYISDEDAKACDMLAVTIQRQDGKEFSKKLYLENFFDSISYTNGDKIYQGSAKGSNHYVAMKFLNVDPEWGSITIKIEPIIAKG